jgi:hypothetical protein
VDKTLRAWQTILSVKERALARAQTELARRRDALEQQQQAVEQRRVDVQAAQGYCEEVHAQLNELHGGEQTVSATLYLRYRDHLMSCGQRVAAAQSAYTAACVEEQNRRAQTDAARLDVSRIDASLDACRKLYGQRISRLALLDEMQADDEVSEVAGARGHRSVAHTERPARGSRRHK